MGRCSARRDHLLSHRAALTDEVLASLAKCLNVVFYHTHSSMLQMTESGIAVASSGLSISNFSVGGANRAG